MGNRDSRGVNETLKKSLALFLVTNRRGRGKRRDAGNKSAMFFLNDLLEVLEHKDTLRCGRGRIIEDDKGIHELIETTRCELDSQLGWVNCSIVTVLIAHYTRAEAAKERVMCAPQAGGDDGL